MWKRCVIGGLFVAGNAATVVSALAADMPALFPSAPYEEIEPPQRYEFGTGWYLRGDLTATDDREPNVLGTLGEKSRDWGYGFGGGAGYKFTDYFRADVTGDYLSTQKHTDSNFICVPGNLNCTVKSNIRRFDGLVNGYWDLGNWYGLVPYIGGGVGFAGIRTDGSITTFVGTDNVFTTTPFGYEKIKGHTDYNFAWAAMAGVAYHISPNLLLDVGYRYLDLGSYTAPEPLYALNPGHKTDLTSHEVRVGVRYMLY